MRDDGSGDILDQYIQFCEILNEQVKLHGRTDEALGNTLRICLERGILAPFLNSRMKGVADIMTTLFDQEKVWEIERHNIAKENRQEGRMEERQAMLRQMLANASILDVSRITGIPEDEIQRIIKQ